MYKNVQPLLASLCSLPEGGVSVHMYLAAQSELSVDGLLDLAEIDEVGRSWRAAAMKNIEWSRKQQEAKRKR